MSTHITQKSSHLLRESPYRLLAWLAYRPIIGIPLLLVAGVSIFLSGRSMSQEPSASLTPS